MINNKLQYTFIFKILHITYSFITANIQYKVFVKSKKTKFYTEKEF